MALNRDPGVCLTMPLMPGFYARFPAGEAVTVFTPPMAPVPPAAPAAPPIGWRCPGCRRVFSPHVPECRKCRPKE